ncbi:LppC putative lipoprotein [Salmonella enterica subsp. arizonae]|uniref:LppC putative lipoprotein n=1 Tax=Salmonella enterica subsp. arizonae TaxID=59203 RepID=A0A2X4W9A3_SALER|nr:LppC putative lipoprotein [Salmonella enterica subsp. arizonae]
MLPTPLVNVQRFKPASTSKIALLLPLSGQAAVFGRTIQQGFEAAKNLGTQAVEMQPAAAPDAPVEPDVDDTQPQIIDGVASPSQASVSDLTDDEQSSPLRRSARHKLPCAACYGKRAGKSFCRTKNLRYLFPTAGSDSLRRFSKTAPVSWSGRC